MVKVRCAAKLNLYLDVVGKREDGYHDVETVFQPVSMYDEIEVSRIEEGIQLIGDDDTVPWDEKNLCYKAADLIMRRAGLAGGVRISVTKKIPSGAGLGGASSDAAGTLTAIDSLFGLQYSKEELMKFALEIGSDIPFFIYGKPAVGKGRGERLESWNGLGEGWFLLVKPDVTISTSWAYSNINLQLTRGIDKDKLNSVLKKLDELPGERVQTWNSFVEVVRERYPAIGEILNRFKREEPLLFSMSGTGSVCFAFFSEVDRAKEVESGFKEEGFSTWVVRPVHQTILLLQ